jgi:translocation and assembly module TamA
MLVPRLPRQILLLAAAAALLMTAGIAEARTASFSLATAGDRQMGDDLKELIEALDKERPLSGDALSLLQGAQARRARLQSALRSRGFYDGTVKATVGGQPIDDPAALDAISARPDTDKIDFRFDVETGPVYRVADMAIRSAGGGAASLPIDLGKLSLAPGKPADAAVIIKTQDEILDQVRESGHALAAITDREVVVDHATRDAHVTYTVSEGPVARMGKVTFTGTDKIDKVWLQRRVPFKEGEPYSPGKVKGLREKLNGLGVFSAVRIKPDGALNQEGELPIEVDLTDRLPRTIGFGASYETILGFGINGYWTHRNLFGQAESIRLSAEVNHIGQGQIPQDLGYAFKADFRKPDWWFANQDLVSQLQVLREVFPAYTRRAVLVSGGIERSFPPHWSVKSSLAYDYSSIYAFGATRDFSLIGIPSSVRLNMADSTVEPTKGYQLTLGVSPYLDTANGNDMFSIFRLTGTTYYDVSGNGRSVLAGRASFGTIPGASADIIPPDKLFYAGGGGSVRGFTYQSAGPRDAYNTPLGGASIVEASVEFRQRIGKSFGAVAFIDAGSAYREVFPNFAELTPRVGTGAGVRYYTDFGAARLDVGVPLNPRQGDPPFGVYVSLGQAF